ncbi:MAG: restriction endonuclease subunit S [Vogesella sp.]|nr:restriction endonuclease subunit S [Vogesella sp.]
MSFDLPVLPDGWQYISLEALSQEKSITYGVVQPGTAVSHGIPIIRVNNFKDGRLELSDVMHIAPDVESKYGRTRLVGGEVLLTIVGSVGQVAVVPKALSGFNVARAVAVIHPLKVVSANWIAICLRSPLAQHLLGSRANTTVQTTINLKDLRALPVPLPPVAIRQAIEDLIYSLDDRIALLHETNATLEAMAQALFKSWFVDFDPVHANAGTRAATLPAELQALFPSTFIDTPQGPVPEGWKLVPFGELLSHTIGGDWGDEQPTEKNDVRVAIIRGTDLPDLANGHSGRVPIRFTSQKKLATRKLQDGDLVLEVSGGSKDQPTGRSLYLTNGILSQFDCPMEPASFCRLLRPAAKEIGVLLAQHMTYIYGLGKTWEYQNQSTGISNFQTTHFLENELVAVPSDDVLRAFAETIRPMVDRAHLTQIAQLVTLRDTLLPRLISGQLRLPDAAATLAEAGA